MKKESIKQISFFRKTILVLVFVFLFFFNFDTVFASGFPQGVPEASSEFYAVPSKTCGHKVHFVWSTPASGNDYEYPQDVWHTTSPHGNYTLYIYTDFSPWDTNLTPLVTVPANQNTIDFTIPDTFFTGDSEPKLGPYFQIPVPPEDPYYSLDNTVAKVEQSEIPFGFAINNSNTYGSSSHTPSNTYGVLDKWDQYNLGGSIYASGDCTPNPPSVVLSTPTECGKKVDVKWSVITDSSPGGGYWDPVNETWVNDPMPVSLLINQDTPITWKVYKRPVYEGQYVNYHPYWGNVEYVGSTAGNVFKFTDTYEDIPPPPSSNNWGGHWRYMVVGVGSHGETPQVWNGSFSSFFSNFVNDDATQFYGYPNMYYFDGYSPTCPPNITGFGGNQGACGGQVNLSWNPSVQTSNAGLASYYQIFKSDHGLDDFYPIDTINSPATSFIDFFALPLNTIFDYRLSAFNAEDVEATSSVVSVTSSNSCSVPTPQNVTATTGTCGGKVDVNWDSVSGADSYQIWRARGAGAYTNIVNSITNTSYTDSGLSTSTSYSYKIVAKRNMDGSTATSSPVSAVSSQGCGTPAQCGTVNTTTGAPGYWPTGTTPWCNPGNQTGTINGTWTQKGDQSNNNKWIWNCSSTDGGSSATGCWFKQQCPVNQTLINGICQPDGLCGNANATTGAPGYWPATTTAWCNPGTQTGSIDGIWNQKGDKGNANLWTWKCQGASGVLASCSFTQQCSGGQVLLNGICTPPPTVTLKINGKSSDTIAYNASGTLSWISTNANSCKAFQDWSGTKATSTVATSTGKLTSGMTFELQCYNGAGTGTSQVSVALLGGPLNVNCNPNYSSQNVGDLVSYTGTPSGGTQPYSNYLWQETGYSEVSGSASMTRTYGASSTRTVVFSAEDIYGEVATTSCSVNISDSICDTSLSTNKTYTIIPKSGESTNPNKILHADTGSAKIQQHGDSAGSNQRWNLTLVDSKFYRIFSKGFPYTLISVLGQSLLDGGGTTRINPNSDNSQKWCFVPLSGSDSGYYKIINKNSGKALDVTKNGNNYDNTDGAVVQQWTYGTSNNDNQKWKLVLPGAPKPNLQISKTSANDFKNSVSDVVYGGDVDLKWTPTNSVSCTATSAGWNGTKSFPGQTTITNLTSDASFTLNCQNVDGDSASETVTATVAALSATCGSTVDQNAGKITWNASSPAGADSYEWFKGTTLKKGTGQNFLETGFSTSTFQNISRTLKATKNSQTATTNCSATILGPGSTSTLAIAKMPSDGCGAVSTNDWVTATATSKTARLQVPKGGKACLKWDVGNCTGVESSVSGFSGLPQSSPTGSIPLNKGLLGNVGTSSATFKLQCANSVDNRQVQMIIVNPKEI